jgi:MarR family transcriptional regulator, organic hydroperoxide resistance regulator
VLHAYPRIYFACHTRHVRDPESGRDVSAHQASILDHLDEVDATSMSDLAAHMGVTVATMSLAIDRLEAKGYVGRERDPNDGRRVLVRATATGVRVREAKSVLDPVRVEAVLGQLSPADRAKALAGLAVLARASNRHMQTQARGSRTVARDSREDAGGRPAQPSDVRTRTRRGRTQARGRTKETK